MVNKLGGHLRLDINYTGTLIVGGRVQNLDPATFLATTVLCHPCFCSRRTFGYAANNTTIIYLTIIIQA